VAMYRMSQLKFAYGFWPLLFLVSYNITDVLKSYIVYAFVPAAACYFLWYFINKIPTVKFKVFCFAALVGFGSIFSLYVVTNYGDYINDSFIQLLIENAQGYQEYHGYISTTGGSGYNLGDIEYTVGGVIKKVIPGINVALFRPYPWEVTNVLTLEQSIEAIFVLLFTLIVLIIVGPIKSIKKIFSDPLHIYFFVYAMLFLFAVGFTSYNYGSLMRYRVPGYLFYLISIVLLLYPYRKPKDQSGEFIQTSTSL